MYKTLGFRWLFEVSCPASAFATADRDDARNPPTLHTRNRYGQGKIEDSDIENPRKIWN